MLKTRSARLSALKDCCNLIPHPVCVLDAQGVLLYANDALLASFSLEYEQLSQSMEQDTFKHFRSLVTQTLTSREKRESKQVLEFTSGQPVKYTINLQPWISDNKSEQSFCVVTFALCNEQLTLENTVRALDTEVLKRRRADRQLDTQYAVSAVLAISKSLQEAAPNILHNICENLGWDWGGFWTKTSDEPKAKFSYLQNSPESHSSRIIPEQLLENAQQLVNSIRATNRPAWISRSANTNLEKTPQHPLPNFTSGSALALPVMSGSECSACMIFFSTENREPDKDILQMLMTLAGNIGQFIDHWRAEQLTRSQGIEASRAETRLRAILSSMREGLCQLDSEGRCIYLNPAAEKMLGYEFSAVRNQKMHDLIYARHLDGNDCNQHECPILSVMYTGKPRYNEEDSFLAKDQTLLTVQFSSAPLVVNDELAGVVIVFRDISELMKLRQQRDSFFAILTHDLKTPLLAADRVLGPLLKGASGPFNTEQSHVLALLKKSNSELLQMVQSVLALYRYSDNKALQIEFVDVKAAAKYAVAQTSGFAESRKITVKQSCSTGDLRSIEADNTAIQHMIANLIENAIKYTPTGGVVDVSLAMIDDSVQIEVRDSGFGLSEVEMANLFVPLQRKLSKRGNNANSGLGLYLCKQIVESYKGHITCESREGHGATFTVLLPAAKQKPTAAPAVKVSG
jgi:PAS domain S-box-containing protein